jgi:ATP-dependent helicase/nuclease subunit A
MYAMVCAKLREQDICEARLRVNFRSSAKIIDWLNEGFDAVLGSESEGPLFDLQEGTVKNVRLIAAGDPRPDAEVHVLPFGHEIDALRADHARDIEGEALAHYFRYLVEDSELRIADTRSGELRRPRYGDIAVMMISTPTVHHLTSELDRIGVPHVVRGGTLFMEDPLHRQFILGLRALADFKDGVARAALMRPPFFAVSLEDLARARATDERSEALDAAQSHIERLRRDRHTKPAGEIARRVLETTGFGRYVAASVNGAQRLARLYELCRALDDVARESNLDFDGATAIARGWLDEPPRIEAPLPVDADAVQVITAHQAKGLEWPIVALWDGWAGWQAFLPLVALTIDPATGEWALELEGLKHDPSDRGLRKREMTLRAAERKRVAYVAATRARDILIVPEAGAPSDKKIAGCLILNGRAKPHRRVAPYKRESGNGAWWKSETRVSMRPISPVRANLDEAWREAASQSFAPYLGPAAVSVIAHATREDVREADERELTPVFTKVGRFGPVFGTAVHRALELILRNKLNPKLASARAVKEGAVEELLSAVVEDVARAHAALEGTGLLRHELQVEYPVAGSLNKATLVSGIIDLLVAAPDGLCLIDFKTDAPPRGDVRSDYPGYVEQVHAYARVLDQSGVPELHVTRTGLLFTADGGLRWV